MPIETSSITNRGEAQYTHNGTGRACVAILLWLLMNTSLHPG